MFPFRLAYETKKIKTYLQTWYSEKTLGKNQNSLQQHRRHSELQPPPPQHQRHWRQAFVGGESPGCNFNLLWCLSGNSNLEWKLSLNEIRVNNFHLAWVSLVEYSNSVSSSIPASFVTTLQRKKDCSIGVVSISDFYLVSITLVHQKSLSLPTEAHLHRVLKVSIIHSVLVRSAWCNQKFEIFRNPEMTTTGKPPERPACRKKHWTPLRSRLFSLSRSAPVSVLLGALSHHVMRSKKSYHKLICLSWDRGERYPNWFNSIFEFLQKIIQFNIQFNIISQKFN